MPGILPDRPLNGSTPGSTKPTVQISGALNFGFVGTDPTVPKVLQQAVGNPTGGAYSWTATPASRISFDNSSSDVVQLSGVNPSTSVGDTTLSVAYTLNGVNATPATLAATSRIFKFLQQSGATNMIPINGPPTFGYEADITYNVYTNPGGQLVSPGFSNVVVLESVSITNSNAQANLNTGTGGTNSNSQIVDVLKLTLTQALSPGLSITANQDLAVGRIHVRNNTLTFSSQGVVVTNNGPTQ
jgi:hypothetical protein